MNQPAYAPRNPNRGYRSQDKEQDPQIIVEGNLREGQRSDYITFRLHLWICVLTFKVILPPEGETKAPVYISFFLDRSKEDAPGTVRIGPQFPLPPQPQSGYHRRRGPEVTYQRAGQIGFQESEYVEEENDNKP